MQQTYDILPTVILYCICLIIIAGIVFYITHLHQQVKDLRNTLKDAQQSNAEAIRKNNSILATITHAVCNPLEKLIDTTNMLLSDQSACFPYEKYATHLQENNGKLKYLLDSIHEISQLESNALTFKPADTDIVQLCKDAIDVAQKADSGLRVELETSIESYPLFLDYDHTLQALASTLYYPLHCNKELRRVYMSLHRQLNIIYIEVYRSPLFDQRFITEGGTIRHQINHLLLNQLGGSYTIENEGTRDAIIVIAYPIKEK